MYFFFFFFFFTKNQNAAQNYLGEIQRYGNGSSQSCTFKLVKKINNTQDLQEWGEMHESTMPLFRCRATIQIFNEWL